MPSIDTFYHVKDYPNLIHTEEQLANLDGRALVFIHGTNTSWNPEKIAEIGTTMPTGMTSAQYANAIRTRWTSRDAIIKSLLDNGAFVYSSSIHPDTHGRYWNPEIDPALRNQATKRAQARVIGIHDDVIGIPTISDTYQAVVQSIRDNVLLIVHFSGARDNSGLPIYQPVWELIQQDDSRTQTELNEALRIGGMERKKLEGFIENLWVPHIILAKSHDHILQLLEKNWI